MKRSEMTPADRRAKFNSMRKLSDEAVQQARAEYDAVPGSKYGISKRLAQRFGVSEAVMSRCVRRISHKIDEVRGEAAGEGVI